jgi:hypothetical protein
LPPRKTGEDNIRENPYFPDSHGVVCQGKHIKCNGGNTLKLNVEISHGLGRIELKI